MVRTDGGRGKGYPARMTLYVFLTCVVASSGGLIFGYDVGVSGNLSWSYDSKSLISQRSPSHCFSWLSDRQEG